MSRLDELIEKLCPDGVEWKELFEITELTSGDRITKAMMVEDGKYPVYGGGVSPTGNYNKYNFSDSITISRAGSAGFVNYVEGKFWSTDVCFIASGKDNGVLIKFVFYYLKNRQYDLQTKIYGGNLPKLNKDYLWNFLIPIPPLEIQEEIVHILDLFTKVTSEITEKLEAELTARRKQYEFYRDSLLTFGDEVERVKLKDVATIIRGTRVVKSELDIKNGFPVYQNSLIPMGYFTKSNRKANTTFIISAGAAGDIGYSNEDYWAADDCLTFECLKRINDRFLFHFIKTKQYYLLSKVRKASIPRLSKVILEKIEIPLPPLEEQERIVSILDKFDKLCNDISEGLPAEIEARKKQYEYYRDKLLNFEELKKS